MRNIQTNTRDYWHPRQPLPRLVPCEDESRRQCCYCCWCYYDGSNCIEPRRHAKYSAVLTLPTIIIIIHCLVVVVVVVQRQREHTQARTLASTYPSIHTRPTQRGTRLVKKKTMLPTRYKRNKQKGMSSISISHQDLYSKPKQWTDKQSTITTNPSTNQPLSNPLRTVTKKRIEQSNKQETKTETNKAQSNPRTCTEYHYPHDGPNAWNHYKETTKLNSTPIHIHETTITTTIHVPITTTTTTISITSLHYTHSHTLLHTSAKRGQCPHRYRPCHTQTHSICITRTCNRN